jgi:hypothetical protein
MKSISNSFIHQNCDFPEENSLISRVAWSEMTLNYMGDKELASLW